MTRAQKLREQELECVFKKFDTDKSGSIELNELFAMFVNFGVSITKDELKELFSIVDTDSSGALSIDEFKKFTSNPMANKVFRRIIMRVR